MKGYKIPEGRVEGFKRWIEKYPKDMEYAWGMSAIVEALEIYPLEELDENPWHTGTPTEMGWYLLHYPECKEQPYELAQWNGEHFVAVKPFHAIIVRIEASSVPYWQKIEDKEQ